MFWFMHSTLTYNSNFVVHRSSIYLIVLFSVVPRFSSGQLDKNYSLPSSFGEIIVLLLWTLLQSSSFLEDLCFFTNANDTGTHLWTIMHCTVGVRTNHSTVSPCHFLLVHLQSRKMRSPSPLSDTISFLNLLILNKLESANGLPSQWRQHWQDIKSRLEMAPWHHPLVPIEQMVSVYCAILDHYSWFGSV